MRSHLVVPVAAAVVLLAATPAAADVTPPVDQAPFALDDQVTIPVVAGSASPVTIDVLANDVDADGDALVLTGVGSANQGTTAMTSDQRVQYTPRRVVQNIDSFTYTISDGRGGTATGTVYLDFTGSFAPAPPPGVIAAPGPGEVTVAWGSVAGATAYHVFRDGVLLGTTSPQVWNDTGLEPGETHTYAVSAIVGSEESDPSAGVPATALDFSGTDIGRLYTQLGGASGALGAETAREHAIAGGREADYVHGLIVASDGTGPQAVTGALAAAYLGFGGPAGRLGFPILPAVTGLRGGGASQIFGNGTLIWSPATGAHIGTGDVYGRYEATGAQNGPLGYPTGDTVGPLRGGGYAQAYQGGTIYWSPATGAHLLTGVLRDKYNATGGQNGPLGYPKTDAMGHLSAGGVEQDFTGGSIFWSPATGAHAVGTGVLRTKWYAMGAWTSIGYPTSDAFGGLRGGGIGQHFQGGSSIYWSSATGAHAVVTVFAAQWAANGAQNGVLGYPTTDYFGPLRGNGHGQHFQGGSIYFTPTTGAHTLTGAIRSAYAAQGWENGRLGYPTSNVYAVQGGRAQHFQGGTITWSQHTNRTSIAYQR